MKNVRLNKYTFSLLQLGKSKNAFTSPSIHKMYKKMKRIQQVLPIAVLFFLAACAGPSEKRAEIMEQLEAGEIPEEVDVFTLDTDQSVVAWEGRRIGGGHDGTIGISHGEFYVFNGELLGGEVIMDMHQIVVLDIENPESNARLQAHLEHDDFFAVDEYPESRFEITSVEPIEADETDFTHRVFGNMTIRGITHGIAFDARINLEENQMMAHADFDLDRTQWNVRYGSGRFFDDLGDRAINDDFGLELNLMAAN